MPLVFLTWTRIIVDVFECNSGVYHRSSKVLVVPAISMDIPSGFFDGAHRNG